ncbi:MAG: methyltransferase [Verrucomicrobia bacterium]|nr:methyltransferase [Verrucomicrobiota bacterium]
MTPRERVLAAIDHKESDKVPLDLGATPSSGISAVAHNKLKRHLGLEALPTRVYDVVQQLAQPEEPILDCFGIDAIDIGRAFKTEEAAWWETRLEDGSAAQYPSWFRPVRQADGSWVAFSRDGTPLAKMPAGGMFYDQIYFPYLDGYPADYKGLPEAMSKVMWAAFPVSPWDHAEEENFWEELRRRALELRQSSDRALMMGAGCNLFEWGTFLRRIDNFLADLVTQPREVERLLDALMEVHLATLEKICRAVGDTADLVRFGDDLGVDGGPFMAPQIYRKLFKPRHKQLCDYVKKHSRMRPFLHSCGSIYALLPDLIEAGFEVINPVQTSTRDMEPERLKKEFGKDITFWGGGCDTRAVLNRASPAEVREHVLKRLEVFAPGGGFVFATVHNILPEVPPENVVAAFDAVREFNGG